MQISPTHVVFFSNLLAGMLAATVSITTVVVEVAMVVGAGLVDAGRSDCVPG